jgi:wobble nucleotide-excising tRNase
MAEKKMQGAIEEIFLDDNTFHGLAINPTLINYFYGKNGSGKSTIARLIRSQSGITPDVSNFEVLVYDKDFITRNIKEDAAMPGVFSLNEGNIEIQNKVAELNEERNKLAVQYQEKKNALTDAKGKLPALRIALESSCWETTADTRNSFAKALAGKRGKKSVFTDELLSIREPKEQDFNVLQALYETAFDESAKSYPLLKEGGKESPEKPLDSALLSQPIISSADTPFAKFIQAVGATDWVKQGHELFAEKTDGHCPYCHQLLPADFAKQLAACFDEEYKSDIDSLENFQQSYNDIFARLLTQFDNNLNCEFSRIDFTVYKEQLISLKKTVQINQGLIQEKLDAPSRPIYLEDTSELVDSLNALIKKFNASIQANNDIIASLQEKQAECKKSVWQHMAFLSKKELDAYRTSLKNVNAEISKLTKEQNDITQKGLSLKSQIAKLNSQIVNVDSTMETINKELLDSGFQGFRLQKNKRDSTKYEIIRDDGSPAHGLSEGERNFIAFLYFYHKVKGREHADSDFKDRIVVIDDPVSSMDSTSLFIVSAIIREMISICFNNGSASKQDTPRYIKQIFILTHNAFFHKEVSYNRLKYYHCVNSYLIQKTRNVSTVKLCVKRDINSDTPAIEKNYTPVRDAYAALWKEYKEAKSATVIMRTARQILEYYFIQISGYEGQTLTDRIMKRKDEFLEISPDGTENREKQHLLNALLRYIGAENQRFNDGLDYVEDAENVEQIRHTFKLIFDVMEQTQHYDMMMAPA